MENNRHVKPTLNEIATAQKDIDIFYGWLKRLENPDPVLRTESAGKGLKLYDEAERDPHVSAVLQTRILSVIGKRWDVVPPGDNPSDEARIIADFVKKALSEINFMQSCREILSGILYGFSVSEIIWQIIRDRSGVRSVRIVPETIRGKHPNRFIFTPDRQLRLLTPESMVEGHRVPERKFIVFSFGASDNPYGKGLGQKLWWPVWFKKNCIKFWLVFLEKYGMPTVVGKYPAGTPKDQQEAMMDAIEAIQTETGIKIPETMAIELLEAKRSGAVTYDALCDYMDRQISKTVLGQTLTTDVGRHGSYAASQTHESVRYDILKADADLLCECLNGSLIRWIVDFNFPDVVEYPVIRFDIRPEPDLKTMAERDAILIRDIGLPVSYKYFYKTYNIPVPEDREALADAGEKNE